MINDTKKILVMPVKNEEWILETSLSSASFWADYIIIADQNSTDRTAEIAKRFNKVIYIKNNHPGLNQSIARQLLLDEARKIPGNHLIFILDADEVLSANALKDVTFWEKIGSLKPGDSVTLQWITLRGSLKQYRNDGSIWSNSWKHFIFKDDRKYNYNLKLTTSEPRMPEHYMKNSIRIENVKNLHFQFIDLERMFSKQRRYRIYDYINSSKKSLLTCIKINSIYYPTKSNSCLTLSNSHISWTYEYKSILGNIVAGTNNNIYWYDKESLEKMKEYGSVYFKYLDIRDIDRQKKAKILGIKGDFRDPRNIGIKLYHKSQGALAILVNMIPNYIKKYF